jgi:hypothetical protein
MRTMLAIDDDVLAAAKKLAVMERKSVGEIISLLARHAMRSTETSLKTRNGVPPLEVSPEAPRVTSELVRQLREKLP